MEDIDVLAQAFAAGYSAYILDRSPTSHPKAYTREELLEWYDGYDRAREDEATAN